MVLQLMLTVWMLDDDYVAVVLSEDDGTTWTELHRWDSTSGSNKRLSEAMPEVTLFRLHLQQQK